MKIDENWNDIKRVFNDSFKSSLHYAIATVNEDGEPHVTPIGSLILGAPGQGLYFEEFTRRLPGIFKSNKRVCVLAVNSGKWFWVKSLLSGRFSTPPAVRLYGTVGEARGAKDEEIEHWQRRVRRFRFSKGHALMWANMKTVRDLRFTKIEPVHLGEMTRDSYIKRVQLQHVHQRPRSF